MAVPDRRFKRVSLSLPPALVADLSLVSGRLGMTRSSFVAEMLQEAVTPFVSLLKALPPEPSSADVRRFRGASVRVIRETMRETLDAIGDSGNE